MKRSAKKLTLHRETLRLLEESRLEQAHGASGVDTCHNSCNSTPNSGCQTCPSMFPC
jgi:hypothetical protein